MKTHNLNQLEVNLKHKSRTEPVHESDNANKLSSDTTHNSPQEHKENDIGIYNSASLVNHDIIEEDSKDSDVDSSHFAVTSQKESKLSSQESDGLYSSTVGNLRRGFQNEFETPVYQTSLEASKPIKASEEYKKMRQNNRILTSFMYVSFLIISPLVFRYALTANIDSKSPGKLVWYNGMDWVDWLVFFTLLFDCFGNVMRYLPMMSGTPSEYDQKGLREIVVTGKAALAHVTPIASERDGIFLRSLIGRTATLLHTAGSRHDILTLYIDVLSNEDASNLARVEKWKAWVQFVELLCALKPRDMAWSETKNNFKASRAIAVDRHVALGKGRSVTYKVDPFAVEFEGYKIDNDNLVHSDNVTLARQQSTFEQFNPIHSNDKRSSRRGVFTAAVENILPAICFMDGWLEVVKDGEGTFPNFNNEDSWKDALQQLFNVAPCSKYFDGQNLLIVTEGLDNLYKAFNTEIKSGSKPKIYRDSIAEFRWRLTRDGMPSTDISWFLFTRCKIPAPPNPRPSFAQKFIGSIFDPLGEKLSNCTRKKIGTIVFIKEDEQTVRAQNAFSAWKKARTDTYQIKKIHRCACTLDPDVTITLWPEDQPAPDVENQQQVKREKVIKMSKLELIQGSGGKAGALNACLDLVRRRTKVWSHEIGHDNTTQPLQLFFGVVDARHMIAEPEIFWNDTIPYFARLKNNMAAKDLGAHAPVILIQFPQYFSNVGMDGYLDNRNFMYYQVWQTLRDCSKTVTSSGTNAIWDATNAKFRVATTSRVEDTATTQNYVRDYHTIHLPVYIAYGIAKATADYIEAVYRWSTGGVELMWWTIFNWKFYHFLIVGFVFGVFLEACVVQNPIGYYAWLTFIAIVAIIGAVEKSTKRLPFRVLNVSFTIVLNTMSWVSNLLSVTWLVIAPAAIAIVERPPLAHTPLQALFYAFIALAVRIPPAVMMDSVVSYIRFLNKRVTDESEFNFRIENFRSNQLYACSFAYSLQSVIHGTFSSIMGYFFHRDNTRWASFKAKKASDLKTVYEKFEYYVYYVWGTLNAPDSATKVWVALLVIFELAMVAYRFLLAAGPTSNPNITITTIFLCSLNLFLIKDIAIVLFPGFGQATVLRPEYGFAAFAIVLIITAAQSGLIPDMTNQVWNFIFNPYAPTELIP